MEFLRFGSSIPGSYWGCCACCIIQNFKVDPSAKASIELVSGDGGGSLGKFAGPTWEDIFWQRIRFGTFDTRDMPNHAFIAILTESQINSGVGAKWMKILKRAGFEFVRTVSNSVYQGRTVVDPATPGSDGSPNHIFMLVRNIGSGAIKDPYMPPTAWKKLEKVVPEAWEYIVTDTKTLTTDVRKAQHALWNAQKDLVKPLLTEAQAKAACPTSTFLSGLRIGYGKQQTREARDFARKSAGLDTKQQTSLRSTSPNVA